MKYRTVLVMPLFLSGLVLPSLAQAKLVSLEMMSQVPSQDRRPAMPAREPGMAQTMPAPAATPKDLEDLVKDFTKIEGVFTIYRSKKGVADAIYMEVPESAFGKYVIIQATASTGIANNGALAFHGQPLNDIVFKMKKVDEGRVIFVEPDLNYRSPSSAEGQRAIDRAIPSDIPGSFEIKAKSKDKKSVLLDVTQFFKSDFAHISGNPLLFSIDPSNTYVDSIKNLPDNLVVRTMYRLAQRPATPREASKSIPFAVSYNLSMVPGDSSYQPRIADTRIGYFTTSFQDLSEAMVTQQNVNYIARWNLQKKNPGEAVSDPVKPVVFWIDNAVPPRYRQAVREGAEMWNPVFEKEAGIRNALVVKQMPDDADWDIADVRYNVIRWTQNLPFAISLFRTNPLTGEILNGCINMDAVFATGGATAYDLIYGPAGQPVQNPLSSNMFMDRFKDSYCFLGQEASQSIGLAVEALESAFTDIQIEAEKDKLVQQRIRQVVGHEMGHTIGLRHNFIASTARTPAQLADPRVSREMGLTASVMDYMPTNIYAIKHPGVDYFSAKPGEYDSWAIHYGYMPQVGPTPKSELPSLMRWASRSGEPGLAFETDQMTNGYDPNIYQFDMSNDPLNWMEKTYNTSRYLLLTLGDRKPKAGESYYEFTKAFNSLLNSSLGASLGAVRYIGGVHVSNAFKGDTGEKAAIIPVNATTQKRALDFVVKGLLSESSMSIPRGYLSKLTTDPNAPGTQGSAAVRSTPIYNSLAGAGGQAIASLFDPARLDRIKNNEYRAPGSTLTMAQLYRSVGQALWSELGDGKEISQIRRQLQRDHLALLTRAVLDRPSNMPEDAITLSYEQLQWLEGATAKAMKTAKGEYGVAHLSECNLRIRQALAALPVRKEG